MSALPPQPQAVTSLGRFPPLTALTAKCCQPTALEPLAGPQAAERPDRQVRRAQRVLRDLRAPQGQMAPRGQRGPRERRQVLLGPLGLQVPLAAVPRAQQDPQGPHLLLLALLAPLARQALPEPRQVLLGPQALQVPPEVVQQAPRAQLAPHLQWLALLARPAPRERLARPAAPDLQVQRAPPDLLAPRPTPALVSPTPRDLHGDHPTLRHLASSSVLQTPKRLPTRQSRSGSEQRRRAARSRRLRGLRINTMSRRLLRQPQSLFHREAQRMVSAS
jgi:hypothetical protein